MRYAVQVAKLSVALAKNSLDEEQTKYGLPMGLNLRNSLTSIVSKPLRQAAVLRRIVTAWNMRPRTISGLWAHSPVPFSERILSESA